jgi:hypothetical protein
VLPPPYQHNRVGFLISGFPPASRGCPASAKEASHSAPTPAKQKALATFATAIIDANDIWGCSSDYPGSLRYYKEDYGVWTGYITCGCWDSELPALVAAYKLDTDEYVGTTWYFKACDASVKSSGGFLRIDFALKKIFKVCADAFQILEASQ